MHFAIKWFYTLKNYRTFFKYNRSVQIYIQKAVCLLIFVVCVVMILFTFSSFSGTHFFLLPFYHFSPVFPITSIIHFRLNFYVFYWAILWFSTFIHFKCPLTRSYLTVAIPSLYFNFKFSNEILKQHPHHVWTCTLLILL